ncbi:hypothetical protein [Streptomyces sp. NPDC002825]|uniref:hypothetical protein n=1 Tax=Streptomyces sp. NPDC002825 TaxID=3154666 RepID=UPI003326E9CF
MTGSEEARAGLGADVLLARHVELLLRAAQGRGFMRKILLQRAAALATTLGLTSMGLLGAGATPAQAAPS